MVELDRPSNSNKRRQTHKENQTSNKQRKGLSFPEEQQNSSEPVMASTHHMKTKYPNT